MNADRNLLFGILAFQNNFIDRSELVAAIGRWTSDKSKSIGQILVEQGALVADCHALLNALTAKHLELHNYDARQSLAALTPVHTLRDDLERLADPDVDATLTYLSAPQVDGGPKGFEVRSVGALSSAGTRFRIVRPLAQGGLGAVFVARDEELHRDVALKEIQKRHADSPESRARFLLEAEITGKLEHPGIIPIYGMGTYADGRPFYAMRFVTGDSLREAIERIHKADGADTFEFEHELRKLLGRFIDVCDAIEYAHSRGILHRDLKPGNIMLGKYGETLVVDWGLARIADRPESDASAVEHASQSPQVSPSSALVFTQQGVTMGTPQYMSPEQADGRWAEVGSASDVYSLGATLYTLITGRPPFDDRQTVNVLKRVRTGDFPLPSEIKSVPEHLEAVCLKAMALKPSDRYTSARQLADDIERWRADIAVSALPKVHVRGIMKGENLLNWKIKPTKLSPDYIEATKVAQRNNQILEEEIQRLKGRTRTLTLLSLLLVAVILVIVALMTLW